MNKKEINEMILHIVKSVLIANERMIEADQGESLHMDIWQKSITVWHYRRTDTQYTLLDDMSAFFTSEYGDTEKELLELSEWVEDLAD